MVSLWFLGPRAKLLFGLQFRRECPGMIRGAGTDSKSSTGTIGTRYNHRYQIRIPKVPQESQDGGLDEGF